jgi:alpha/beta superfamily hydrolase
MLALRDPRIARLVLVTLPVRAFDLTAVADLRIPGLLVAAEHDEFGNLAEIRARIPDLPASLEAVEVPGADHYFSRRSQELQARVRDWAERTLGVPS